MNSALPAPGLEVLLSVVALLAACSAGPIATGADGSEGAAATEGTTTSEDADEGDWGEVGNETLWILPELDVQPVHACDPFAQDCPAGEKCVPYASAGGVWDANKCVPVLGDAAFGEPCVYDGVVAGTDTCGGDSMCWNVLEVDGQLVGECAAFCLGSADRPECPVGTECLIKASGSPNVCLETCNPLGQDCSEGLGCYWDGSGFRCAVAGTIDGGSACGWATDCEPGHYCAPAEVIPGCPGAGCCAAFCDLSAASCVAAQTECVAFFEQGSAPAGLDQLGVCIGGTP